MKRFKNVLVMAIACVILMSLFPMTTSAVEITEDLILTDGCCIQDYEGEGIIASSSCTHNGMKNSQNIGTCWCGNGWVFRVTCAPCGAFLYATCSYMWCTYW